MLNQLAKIKRALIKCGRAKRFDANVAKKLLAAMGYFSDRSVPYSLSAADFIARFPLPNLHHNAEKTFLGFVENVHFIFQYAADEVGDPNEPFPAKTILFFAVEVKNGFYLRKNYETLALEVTKRFSLPVVVLFLSKFNNDNACLTFSFVNRKKHGKHSGQVSLGGNITIANIDCRCPQREHLEILLRISMVDVIKKNQNKAAFIKDLRASWLAPELLEEIQNTENLTAHAILFKFFAKILFLVREQGYIDELALADNAPFHIFKDEDAPQILVDRAPFRSFDHEEILESLENLGVLVSRRGCIRDISVFDITQSAFYSLSNEEIEEQAESLAAFFTDIYNLEWRYRRSIGKYPLLNREEEKKIAKAMFLEEPDGDIATLLFKALDARKRIIESNLRWAATVAYKYRKSTLPFIDLIQEGNIGLINVVEKFDHKQGRFSTYARFWIRQSVTRAIADKELVIRIPVHLVEKHKKIKIAEHEFLRGNGILPTVEELSKKTSMPAKEISDILEIFERQPVQEEKAEDPFVGVNDFSDEYDEMESRVFKEQLVRAMLNKHLTKQEAKVISLRYGIGVKVEYTLQQIGGIYNVTRERIRQIEVKAIRKLRKAHSPFFLF